MRLCPQHGTHLTSERRTLPRNASADVLVCPTCGDCSRWAVWDRRMLKVIGYGTADTILVIEGECDDVLVLPWAENRKRVHRARKWDR